MTDTPKPRRKNKTHAEQEADLKAKLAALDAKKDAALRKDGEAVLALLNALVERGGMPAAIRENMKNCAALIDRQWLGNPEAGKPGAG